MSIFSKITELNEAAENHELNTEGTPTETLISLKPILKIVLQIVKIFTNDAADKKIDQIIEWLDKL